MAEHERTLDGSDTVWAPHRRRLTVGLVGTITLVAFEALAVATVMPEVKDDLGGLGLYGWVFSGFFLGSLLGIVVAGRWADRHGLALPFASGLVLFAIGLVVGGTATSMAMLVVGRVAQGFGAGAIPPTAYTAIGRGYAPAARPKMFAILSTAWVVPGLIGPAAAIGIEHALSWRWVFLLLLPLVAAAGALALAPLRSLGRAAPVAAGEGRGEGARRGGEVPTVLALVVGVGAVFAAGSGPPAAVAVALVAVGAPVAAVALARLLPPGTLRLRAGVPATVAVRGVLTFSFFAADAYLPLAVVDGRDGPSWMAGAALTAASVTWTAGSWTQARLIERIGPRRIDRTGFVVLAAAMVALVLVGRGAPVALVVPAWAIAGFGIGFAYAPLSVTVLASAARGQEGAASAAIQLSDAVGIALGTGVGGWIVAAGDGNGWAVSSSVTIVFALAAAVAALGAAASGRLPARLPAGDEPAAEGGDDGVATVPIAAPAPAAPDGGGAISGR